MFSAIKSTLQRFLVTVYELANLCSYTVYTQVYDGPEYHPRWLKGLDLQVNSYLRFSCMLPGKVPLSLEIMDKNHTAENTRQLTKTCFNISFKSSILHILKHMRENYSSRTNHCVASSPEELPNSLVHLAWTIHLCNRCNKLHSVQVSLKAAHVKEGCILCCITPSLFKYEKK